MVFFSFGSIFTESQSGSGLFGEFGSGREKPQAHQTTKFLFSFLRFTFAFLDPNQDSKLNEFFIKTLRERGAGTLQSVSFDFKNIH